MLFDKSRFLIAILELETVSYIIILRYIKCRQSDRKTIDNFYYLSSARSCISCIEHCNAVAWFLSMTYILSNLVRSKWIVNKSCVHAYVHILCHMLMYLGQFVRESTIPGWLSHVTAISKTLLAISSRFVLCFALYLFVVSFGFPQGCRCPV